MEIEQLEKRLEWLDEERRKDKALVSTLENRFSQLENKYNSSKKELGKFQDNLAQMNLLFRRLEQLEGTIAQMRQDFARLFETQEKTKGDIQREVEKKIAGDMEETNHAIQDIRKGYQSLHDYKKVQKELDTDISLVKVRLDKIDQKLLENQNYSDQYQQSQKLYDETRKVENKRITDMQGEVAAYRKRMDEMRSRIDLVMENFRNAEARLSDLTGAESERKSSQVAFMEKYNQQQVERDRQWREWQQMMEQVIHNGSSIEMQFKNLEETLRSVRKSREQLDEAGQKIDRRVNEITEMHRLNEDHFRQEWNSFKADDQKRWANYTLIMDEQQKENDRSGGRLDKRILQLEDLTQQMNDQMQNMQNEEEKRLQQLIAMAHDWFSTYEHLLGKNSGLS